VPATNNPPAPCILHHAANDNGSLPSIGGYASGPNPGPQEKKKWSTQRPLKKLIDLGPAQTAPKRHMFSWLAPAGNGRHPTRSANSSKNSLRSIPIDNDAYLRLMEDGSIRRDWPASAKTLVVYASINWLPQTLSLPARASDEIGRADPPSVSEACLLKRLPMNGMTFSTLALLIHGKNDAAAKRQSYGPRRSPRFRDDAQSAFELRKQSPLLPRCRSPPMKNARKFLYSPLMPALMAGIAPPRYGARASR